jgi:hypothetical protein
MVTRLYLVREHRLHGIVTGVETVRIMSSIEDSLDRLLVSFKDAKVSFTSVSRGRQVHRTLLTILCPRSLCWNGPRLYTTFLLFRYTLMNVHRKWFVH